MNLNKFAVFNFVQCSKLDTNTYSMHIRDVFFEIKTCKQKKWKINKNEQFPTWDAINWLNVCSIFRKIKFVQMSLNDFFFGWQMMNGVNEIWWENKTEIKYFKINPSVVHLIYVYNKKEIYPQTEHIHNTEN